MPRNHKPEKSSPSVKTRVLEHLELALKLIHKSDEKVSIRVAQKLVESLPAIQFERAASTLMYEDR